MKTAKKTGKMILAFQDDPFDVRAEIGEGKRCSSIKLEISNHGYQNDEESRHKEIEMSLSYHQAKILAEILENFVSSKSCYRKAQTPVHISSFGEIKWSGFPYPV